MHTKKMKYVQFLFILLLISNKPNNMYCDIDPFHFFFIKVHFLGVPPTSFPRTTG